MEVPFWEESYKKDIGSTFGIHPNPALTKVLPLLKKDCSILDIGTGDGKNPLYLAKLGFKNIEAFDFSENAISKLQRLATNQNLNINAWIQDLRDFTFSKPYDLVMSFGALHFVEKHKWVNFLHEAKSFTKTGGIHIIQLFSNALPATPDIAKYAIGLADDGEIKDIYDDWNILHFSSYIFEDEHPGIPKHLHSSNKIIARKP